MRFHLWLLAILFLAAEPVVAADTPNVLLICVDDLRPELASFGAEHMHTPNIDALAARGRAFTRHYVQAPTCGASRYALLTGLYGPAGNHALFERAKKLKANPDQVPPSMPEWFRANGYETVSVGKVSHHPGGRGGANWDNDQEPEMPNSWDVHLLPAGDWQHPRGAMHGLAHGEIRGNAKEMDVYQSADGPDEIYPDGLIVNESLSQLQRLSTSGNPFFMAVGIIRPHLPFGAPAKYFEPYREVAIPEIPHPRKPGGKTTWHGSGEFMKYNRWGRNPNEDAEFADLVRRHYMACVSYADAQVGRLLKELNELDQTEHTIVVLWGDHGWHLGEHAVWGKHTLFEESLRSPLIICADGMPEPGGSTDAIVETIDVFPTLVDLAGLPQPEYVAGQSLKPLLEDPTADGGTAVSYAPKGETIRTDRYRLIEHRGGHVELYDHDSEAGETKSVAEEHPDVVKKLKDELKTRLGR